MMHQVGAQPEALDGNHSNYNEQVHRSNSGFSGQINIEMSAQGSKKDGYNYQTPEGTYPLLDGNRNNQY